MLHARIPPRPRGRYSGVVVFLFLRARFRPFYNIVGTEPPPPLTPDTVVPRTERVFEGFERVSKWPWGARRSSGAHAQPRVYVLHTRPMVHALVHENIKTTHVGVYKYYTGKPADRTSTRIIPSILRLPTTIFRR